MKKYKLFITLFSCLIAFSLVGCATKDGVDDTENQNAQIESDYSMYNFTEKQWVRDAESDRETLRFLANGEYRYSCSCGNPVDDSDMVESYSYDDTTKTFTLNYYEELEDVITEIKLIRCDDEKLELDFDGEIRTFFLEDASGEN